MRKIKIGFIGTSKMSHGSQIFERVRALDDVFEVAGYALPENEREKFPEQCKIFEGYNEIFLDEMLNDDSIEAVFVETEEIYLSKYAKMAAEHGKHIHMEKPGGTSLSDFEAMIDAVKRGGKVFHTGYMYRYNPNVKALMKKVKSGELGEIISVDAQMNCYHLPENRAWLECLEGGMMFWLGCHLVDIILQIKGQPDEIIPLSTSTGVDGVTSTDFGMAVFKYKNGISLAKTSATDIGGFARRNIVVTGTKGSVEIKPIEMGTAGGQYSDMNEYKVPLRWDNLGETTRCELFQRYDEMILSFAAMVRGEKENPYTYDYELELYKTVLRASGMTV